MVARKQRVYLCHLEIFEDKPINLDMEYLYNILESELYQYKIDKVILKENLVLTRKML